MSKYISANCNTYNLEDGTTILIKKTTPEDIKDEIIKISNEGVGNELTFEDTVAIIRMYVKYVSASRNGWSGIWLYLRRQMMLTMLKKGWARTDIIKYVIENVGVGEKCAYNYLNDAFDYIKTSDEELKEDARLTTIEKLQSLIKECLERGKHKEALIAYEQLNKINGLYSETKNINVRDIKFQFGGGDAVGE